MHGWGRHVVERVFEFLILQQQGCYRNMHKKSKPEKYVCASLKKSATQPVKKYACAH